MVAQAQRAVAEAESALMTAVRDYQHAEEGRRRRDAITQKYHQADARSAHIELALGIWTLFAKCMSNDGVIALSIDDAGPTLSGLANDLLPACYGPRFTVSFGRSGRSAGCRPQADVHGDEARSCCALAAIAGSISCRKRRN